MKEKEIDGVGGTLRKRRMLRGESHEAVHQHTRIPKRFLAAMEEERFDELPGPVYLRGFLKTYCDHLDMPFEPLWQAIQGAPAGGGASGPQGQEVPSQGAAAPAKTGRKMVLPLTESTLIPALLFTGLLIFGGMLWVLKAPGEAPAAGERPGARAALGGQRLRLSALADCWVHLLDGGSLLFEGNVPAGTTQEWRGEAGFKLKAAPLGAVRVELDGSVLVLKDVPRDSDGAFLIAR